MKSELFSRIPSEKLEGYLEGMLGDKESAEIDALLEEDKDLQLLVDEYVNIQMSINNAALQAKRRKPHYLRPLWIGLAAACVVGVVLLLAVPQSQPEANVIEKPVIPPVVRGDSDAFDAQSDTIVPLPEE